MTTTDAKRYQVWAANLSDSELADELIVNLWTDIPAREHKKAALLTAAIDRLREHNKLASEINGIEA